MMIGSTLTREQRQRAWTSAYRFSLDLQANDEIAWEAQLWRQLGAPDIADLCDQLLAERRAGDLSIPAETTPHDLGALWQGTRHDAFGWVSSEGHCLRVAMSLAYFFGPVVPARPT